MRICPIHNALALPRMEMQPNGSFSCLKWAYMILMGKERESH